MTGRITAAAMAVMILIIAALSVMLTVGRADLRQARSDGLHLRADNEKQKAVITAQLADIRRFNLVVGRTRRLNALADARTDKTVTEYRERLRYEKTCNYPVPDDVARGLLDYTYRLRAGALYAGAVRADAAGITPAASARLTYCQAVLWIRPLLSAIEKANSQLAGIREISEENNNIQ